MPANFASFSKEIRLYIKIKRRYGKRQPMSETIELRIREKVGYLMLKRAPVNALDETTLYDLMKAVDQVENDGALRVLIITSGIRDIFCAGGDLKYWPHIYPEQAEVVSEKGRKAFMKIERLKVPTIAVIQGQVIGDGLSLALSCDIRLASKDSTFQLPEIDYGFIPGWGTIGRLMKVVGKTLTTELLLFGEKISAVRAQAIGLVNQIKSSADLMPSVLALADRIAIKPPLAVRYAKAALQGELANQSRDQVNYELECFKAVWGSREWKERINMLFKSNKKLEYS